MPCDVAALPRSSRTITKSRGRRSAQTCSPSESICTCVLDVRLGLDFRFTSSTRAYCCTFFCHSPAETNATACSQFVS
jgi:hypothetical protein